MASVRRPLRYRASPRLSNAFDDVGNCRTLTSKTARESKNNGDTSEEEAFLHDVREHSESIRAERHANAELAASCRDDIGELRKSNERRSQRAESAEKPAELG